jgi:hypothetical protein
VIGRQPVEGPAARDLGGVVTVEAVFLDDAPARFLGVGVLPLDRAEADADRGADGEDSCGDDEFR